MTISTGMYEVLQALAHKSATVITRPGSISPGKVAAIWQKYQAEAAAFVRAQKLQAVQILAEPAAAPAIAEKPAAVITELPGLVWWNPRGGWPLAHFHVGDNIYPATPAQWDSFASQVVAKVGANLQANKAKVSFDQLTELAEAAQF